jgi:hypothetical protein
MPPICAKMQRSVTKHQSSVVDFHSKTEWCQWAAEEGKALEVTNNRRFKVILL